ncbi:MAG: caspase family protein [Pseudomonadota bacterium]
MTSPAASIDRCGGLRFAAAAVLALACAVAFAQQTSTVRTTELRSDKLGIAPVMKQLPAGAPLTMLSLEGGWALVHAAGQTGWVRAGALALQSPAAAVTLLASGRESAGNSVMTLGVRGLPARGNRHALIIGVSRYADPSIPELPGARVDRESATQMAQAMQVPLANTRYLQDGQATAAGIRAAIAELDRNVQGGDRVFIHYSGHGTRFNDPAAGGCVEALLAYDGGQQGTITNREMTELLAPLIAKTDKIFVMFDACFSGGLIQPAARSRGLANANDEGRLRPKFADTSDQCGRPVNVRTRNLLVELAGKGGLPQDVVHLSAARDNEISFDDEFKGGLATQFVRDCMLRDVRDLDGSGAYSIDEIRSCAQEKIERRMDNDANFKPHHLTLSGNAAFVPTWFSQAMPQPAAPAAAVAASSAVAAVIPAPVAPTPPPPLTGEQALAQMFAQRDGKRRVQVSLSSPRLAIGRDSLDFSVRSDRPGYVYVALAGSDNQSVYMLFPNELDRDNRIDAGKAMSLPRASWRVRAAGPAGIDNLLVIVSDAPRDLASLGQSRAGPFLSSLNDAQGRAALGALMTTSASSSGAACRSRSTSVVRTQCSDAYGAAMVAVEEIQ